MTLDLGIFGPWNVSEVMSLWEDESAASQGPYFLQPRLQKGGQEGHEQIQANTARLGSPKHRPSSKKKTCSSM